MGIPESNGVRFDLMRLVGHLRIDVGASLHLCVDDWNLPTPVQRRLYQSRSGQTHSKWHGTGLGTKSRNSD